MSQKAQAGSVKKRRIRHSPSDRIFMFLVYFLLSLMALLVLYPLIYVVSSSFSSAEAVRTGSVWLWPVDFSLEAYEAVFRSSQIMTGFANSLFYMITGTIINLFMTMICAYPLSRKEFYGRGIITGIFVFTMYFSGGLVPSYLLMRNLNLLDTRWAMLLPGAMSVWFVIVARTYLQSNIPDEMFEAARIDGCSEIRFLGAIVLPLSAPIIAVLALYYGVGHWNSYFNAMIYLKDPDKYPLQLFLRNILVLNEVDTNMITDPSEAREKQGLADLLKYAVIVVSSVPVLIIYPFVQKHFVKGVMIGALKG